MRRDFQDLPPVTTPTTFVWSDHDGSMGRVAAEGCADQVDAVYRFVTYPGVTHSIPEEQPHALAAEILTHCAGW